MVALTGIEVLIVIFLVRVVREIIRGVIISVNIIAGVVHVVGTTAFRAQVIRMSETFGRDIGAVEEVIVVQATVGRRWAMAAHGYGCHLDAVVLLFFAAANEEVVLIVAHLGSRALMGLERCGWRMEDGG